MIFPNSERHIAILTTSFPYGQPGSEAAGSFVVDLAVTLSEHVNVTVVAPRWDKEDEHYGNLRVRRFPVPYLPLSELKPYNPVYWPSIIRTLWAGLNEIEGLVSDEKIDHVIALWALPSGYWARNVWKKYGIPYSVWALGSDIWTLGKIPVVKGLLAKVLKDSHACFADGYRLKQDVEEMSGRSCEFLASARNLPATAGKKMSTAPPYRLAFLGRWHPNKGVDLMLESLGLLSDEDWNKVEEIRVCGGGLLEAAVKSGCDSLKKNGRPVTVRGYLNREEAAELLVWADYLLLPSRIESIPVVFSDAMQAGCPVVVTPVGDLPMLMEKNRVGILADDVSPTAFASAVHSALNMSPAGYSSEIEKVREQFDIRQSTLHLLHFLKKANE